MSLNIAKDSKKRVVIVGGRKCHPLRPVDAAQVPCPLAELGRHSLAEGRLHLRGYGWMG